MVARPCWVPSRQLQTAGVTVNRRLIQGQRCGSISANVEFKSNHRYDRGAELGCSHHRQRRYPHLLRWCAGHFCSIRRSCEAVVRLSWRTSGTRVPGTSTAAQARDALRLLRLSSIPSV